MARRAQLTLASNAAVTGNAVDWPGGNGAFYAEGTFGGGTVKLQTQSPNGTWMDVGTATTLTAAGVGGFTLPAGPIRVNIATATAVFAYAVGIPNNAGG